MTHVSQCLSFLLKSPWPLPLTAIFRSSGFLAILAPSLAMAADADSSTAIEIHLHTLEGRVEPLKVSRSEITLEEIQEPILQLFGKNVPASI